MRRIVFSALVAIAVAGMAVHVMSPRPAAAHGEEDVQALVVPWIEQTLALAADLDAASPKLDSLDENSYKLVGPAVERAAAYAEATAALAVKLAGDGEALTEHWNLIEAGLRADADLAESDADGITTVGPSVHRSGIGVALMRTSEADAPLNVALLVHHASVIAAQGGAAFTTNPDSVGRQVQVPYVLVDEAGLKTATGDMAAALKALANAAKERIES